MLTKNYDAIVVGAGIVGLAMARALGVRGKKVLVLEKSQFAVGASIRNFGMIWPIGQQEGMMYERAMLSRSIWLEVAEASGLWIDPVGSLHLAYSNTEMDALSAFHGMVSSERNYTLLNAATTLKVSDSIVSAGLKGGLLSTEEAIVDPPKAIAALPAFLHERYGVDFQWQTPVNAVETGKVISGNNAFQANEIFICSGPDFETLYPELFAQTAITKCKLQMMRFVSQPDGWRLGPSLCGGLSLIHYNGFKVAGDAVTQLKKEFENKYPEYIEWGIHVMVSQNQSGELIVGDSHEYGLTHDPFDRQMINKLILKYLSGFARFANEEIAASWNGIYPKMTNGETEFITSPADGITIVNGLGGSGMTLSFGLAEQLLSGTYQIK